MSKTSNTVYGTPQVHAPVSPARPVGLAEGFFPARASWLLAWSAKGGLAVLDQALFAGAHFVLNILLARWLPPAEYGAFALAYSIFLFFAAVHTALITEPMMIFGSGKYVRVHRSYLGILLRRHLALTLPAGLLLVGIAIVVGRLYSPSVERTLIALGLALPLMLLLWVTRRAFYIKLRPGWATAGGAVYFGLSLVLSWWFYQAELLSPVTGILVIGIAALAASSLQLAYLRPYWAVRPEELTSAQVTRDHWQYGRWALASAVAMWFPLNVYYFALPFWAGMEGAGALKALMNLANPVLHSLMAFGLLLVPLLVRHRDHGGVNRMRQTVQRFVGLFLLGSAAYLVLLWIFRIEIILLLYGGRYAEFSGLPVLLVGLLPLAASLTVALGSTLRALERPDQVFWCYVALSTVALAAGLPLTARFGLVGALSGLLLSYVVTAIAMFVFLRRPFHPAAEPERTHTLGRGI